MSSGRNNGSLGLSRAHLGRVPWRSRATVKRAARIPVTPVATRYCKGQKSLLGNLWWEMHEECMVICAEALLPLAITAIFTTGGPHNSQHAAWGEDTRDTL